MWVEIVSSLHTFGCPSRSSLWKTWQNFQQSTALLERGSLLTAAQKVWAPFSWWVPKMQGDGDSQGSLAHRVGHFSYVALIWLLTNVTFHFLLTTSVSITQSAPNKLKNNPLKKNTKQTIITPTKKQILKMCFNWLSPVLINSYCCKKTLVTLLVTVGNIRYAVCRQFWLNISERKWRE